ncbi:MAG: hypothetical protein WKF37_01780 [Bryobacteraceae bacterium]
MVWRNPQFLAFTRLEIVSKVPSASGIFSVMSGDVCIHIGETWNLKAHLLQLANVASSSEYRIVFELCPESERDLRRIELASGLAVAEPRIDSPCPRGGLSFWI